MPRIYVCFLWHMHQPFYKDLVKGEYRLPWTRLHALKDYYGMVSVLRDFPEVKQTFNLVPGMLEQIEEYAAGKAVDPFLRCALKPAEELTTEEMDFMLHYFFQANEQHLIRRYPRYGELFDAWRSTARNSRRARLLFSVQAFRDLQVLSQLAWFDEEYLTGDPDISGLVRKGRNYSLEDQALMGRKQNEILGKVLPVYREFAESGQIEISSTPHYHPILPLLCDSDIAGVSHPYVSLPPRFRYPEDARAQLEKSREYCRARFGAPTAGLWPSEGSVSDEVLAMAADLGYQWVATDNGVLSRTLHAPALPAVTYRPYLWQQGGRRIHAIFRDHYLSDLVGFVYSRMDAHQAAEDLLHRIRENCRGILAEGRDALVPVILDGENAWEHYHESGREFLRALYRRLTDDGTMLATTVSEALSAMEPAPLDHIFPGSWISANFDVWIGFEEDNRAWEYLLRARQAYERATSGAGPDSIPEDRRRLAYEELLIAEGSDWCWWYGPHHHSENQSDFDRLFRDHVANVYRALGQTPPEELSRPILRLPEAEIHEPPTAPVAPVLDGEVTSYFEWMGAGLYRLDQRSGAMHGQRYLIQELRYGADQRNLYLRLDFEETARSRLPGAVVRLNLESGEQSGFAHQVAILIGEGHAVVESATCPAEAAFAKVLEVKLPLSGLGVSPGERVRLQLSLWEDALPADALPRAGWLVISTEEPREWPL